MGIMKHDAPAPELQQMFCEIVARGNFRYIARASCGISEAQFKRWARNAQKADKAGELEDPYYLFFRAVLKAEASCHCTVLQDVLTQGDADLKFKFLQRRYNKLYSNNPNAHIDDVSGKEEIDPVRVLADRLNLLIDGEPKNELEEPGDPEES